MDRGEIYLGPFLYSDLAGSKQRPICIVSTSAYNAGPDVMVAMVTSGAHVLSPRLGDVVLRDWQQSGLLRPSVVRAGRAATTTTPTRRCIRIGSCSGSKLGGWHVAW